MISVYFDEQCSQMFYKMWYTVGSCVTTMEGKSAIYKCSVNDTYSSAEPQQADASKPVYAKSDRVVCSGVNNCTDANPAYYITDFFSDGNTCPIANATASAAYPVTQNFSLGGCYLDGTFNTENTCTEDFLVTTQFQNPRGCTGKPVSAYYTPRSCMISPLVKRDSTTHDMAGDFFWPGQASFRDLMDGSFLNKRDVSSSQRISDAMYYRTTTCEITTAPQEPITVSAPVPLSSAPSLSNLSSTFLFTLAIFFGLGLVVF